MKYLVRLHVELEGGVFDLLFEHVLDDDCLPYLAWTEEFVLLPDFQSLVLSEYSNHIIME